MILISACLISLLGQSSSRVISGDITPEVSAMPYRYRHQSLVMKQATVNQLYMLVCVWWNFLKTGKTCCYGEQKHGIFKGIFFLYVNNLIYILLDVLVWSIAVYFYELCRICVNADLACTANIFSLYKKLYKGAVYLYFYQSTGFAAAG